MKKGSAFYFAFIALFGIIALWFIKEIFFPNTNFGLSFNIGGNYGGNHMYMNGNYGYGMGTFSVLLVFLIKFFIVIFIISLLVALFMTAKNYLFTAQDIATFKGTFSGNSKPKKACTNCGKTVEDDWKVCPHCGIQLNEDDNF